MHPDLRLSVSVPTKGTEPRQLHRNRGCSGHREQGPSPGEAGEGFLAEVVFKLLSKSILREGIGQRGIKQKWTKKITREKRKSETHTHQASESARDARAFCFPAWSPLRLALPPRQSIPQDPRGLTMASPVSLETQTAPVAPHTARPHSSARSPRGSPTPRLAKSLTFSCLRTSSCRWRKYWSLSCCFTSWCLSCR